MFAVSVLMTSLTAHGSELPRPAKRYRIVDLGTLGGASSHATDINSKGEVVGYALVSDEPYVMHAFVHRQGEMVDLGAPRDDRSSAWGINDSGQISATSGINDNAALFLVHEGDWTDLRGGTRSFVRRINGAGVVASSSFQPQHLQQCDANGCKDLGALVDDRAVGFDINDGGTIVGVTGIHISGERGFAYQDGDWTDLGKGSRAMALNHEGVIVGSIANRAAKHTPEGWVVLAGLDALDSTANDINGEGQIVGSFFEPREPAPPRPRHDRGHNALPGQPEPPEPIISHGFVVDDGIVRMLPDLADGGSMAEAINDDGSIVGVSYTKDGHEHAVLWRMK